MGAGAAAKINSTEVLPLDEDFKDKQGLLLDIAQPVAHVCSLLPPEVIFTRSYRVGSSWLLRS